MLFPWHPLVLFSYFGDIKKVISLYIVSINKHSPFYVKYIINSNTQNYIFTWEISFFHCQPNSNCKVPRHQGEASQLESDWSYKICSNQLCLKSEIVSIRIFLHNWFTTCLCNIPLRISVLTVVFMTHSSCTL